LPGGDTHTCIYLQTYFTLTQVNVIHTKLRESLHIDDNSARGCLALPELLLTDVHAEQQPSQVSPLAPRSQHAVTKDKS
jgi:hypothetical protein